MAKIKTAGELLDWHFSFEHRVLKLFGLIAEDPEDQIPTRNFLDLRGLYWFTCEKKLPHMLFLGEEPTDINREKGISFCIDMNGQHHFAEGFWCFPVRIGVDGIKSYAVVEDRLQFREVK